MNSKLIQLKYLPILMIFPIFLYIYIYRFEVPFTKHIVKDDFNLNVTNHTYYKQPQFIDDAMYYVRRWVNFKQAKFKVQETGKPPGTQPTLTMDLKALKISLNMNASVFNESLVHELRYAKAIADPVLAIPREEWKTFNETWMGHQLPLLNMGIAGRLGNTMGTYASLLGIKRAYNIPLFIMKNVQDRLLGLFPHITVPTVPLPFDPSAWLYLGTGPKSLSDYSPLEELAAGVHGAKRGMSAAYPFEMQIFNAYREEVVKEFTFSNQLRMTADTFLLEIANKYPRDIVFVGIHIRRTDYVSLMPNYYKATLPYEDFVRKAMLFFKQRIRHPVFVVASDDKQFVKEAFAQDPHFYPTKDEYGTEEDLAILSSCNHSIITIGSYGFWSGYMTGGTVLYPDIETDETIGYYFTKKYYEKSGLNQFIPLSIKSDTETL